MKTGREQKTGRDHLKEDIRYMTCILRPEKYIELIKEYFKAR
jgi:hypothetical protein